MTVKIRCRFLTGNYQSEIAHVIIIVANSSRSNRPIITVVCSRLPDIQQHTTGCMQNVIEPTIYIET